MELHGELRRRRYCTPRLSWLATLTTRDSVCNTSSTRHVIPLSIILLWCNYIIFFSFHANIYCKNIFSYFDFTKKNFVFFKCRKEAPQIVKKNCSKDIKVLIYIFLNILRTNDSFFELFIKFGFTEKLTKNCYIIFFMKNLIFF